MKTAESRTFIQSVIGTGLLLAGSLFAAQSALAACTAGNWSGISEVPVIPGSPDPDNVQRYSGLCAMQTPSGSVSFVQDNSPGGIDRIRARFYVLNNLTGGAAQIYRGFSTTDGSSPLFTVSLDPSGNVTLRDNTTTTEPVAQSGSTKWLSVEIDWIRGTNGSISLSINGQPANSKNFDNSSASSLQSVQLGNLNGAAGTLNFDAYESRRSTAVGRLLACDARSDDAIDVLDALDVINEINEVGLANGQPDCDEDGDITALDVLDIINIINT